ncbi:MAG TPA: hypothetical protein EYN66_13515 [Myxococcales bacterium]|nr:hypothetical protein [Myxococcales bacterium]
MQLELASSVPGRASIVIPHTKHSFTYKHGPIAYHINYGNDDIRFQLGAVTDIEFVDVGVLTADHKVLNYLMNKAGATKAQIKDAA